MKLLSELRETTQMITQIVLHYYIILKFTKILNYTNL